MTPEKNRNTLQLARESGEEDLDALALTGTFDFQALTCPAHDPQERRSRSAYISNHLFQILEARLSRDEMHRFRLEIDKRGGEGQWWDKFDEVLIERAATLGWRMYECTPVLTRIAQWSDRVENGLEKLKRFNAAVNRYAELKRGMAHLPFTEPEWYPSRKKALQEIKALRNKLAAQFVTKNSFPNLDDLYSEIRGQITATPNAYPFLRSNLVSLLGFLKEKDSSRETVAPLTNLFLNGDATVANVVDGWFDYQGGTARDKSRQIISRLGSRRRR